MQFDLSVLSKLSLHKQCESLDISMDTLIVPRGTRKATISIPLLTRVTSYLIDHFTSMGYVCGGGVLEEILIFENSRNLLDYYTPDKEFEEEIKKQFKSGGQSLEEFDRIKIFLIGMNEYHKTLKKLKKIGMKKLTEPYILSPPEDPVAKAYFDYINSNKELKEKMDKIMNKVRSILPPDAFSPESQIIERRISSRLDYDTRYRHASYNAEINQATHAELNQAVDSHEGQ